MNKSKNGIKSNSNLKLLKEETPGELAANLNWLQANAQNYHNLWLALNNGELLCSGLTKEDIQSFVDKHPNKINIMCLQVGSHYR